MNRSLSPAWLLAILTGLNLFNYLDRYVMSAVLTPLQQTYRITDAELGLVNTIFMIGYFVTSPFFGYLGDRLPRKWLIALGILIWSLGTVLTGYANSFVMLLWFRVLVGVGEASYATISPSLISDTFSSERRNNALTIFYVAIPVGSALGYLLGGWIAAHYGWRWAFICAGAPGLLLALILLPFAEPKRGQMDGGAIVEKPKFKDIGGLFSRPDYQLVVWGYTAYTFALGAFGFWGPTFLHRVHGVSVETSATFFGAVLVVAGLLGTLIGGLAATAWQKRNPAGYAHVLSLSVITAAPMAVLAFWTRDQTFSMVCLAAAMFLIFLCTGPVNTLILETVPTNLRATAMAVSIFAIHLFGDMWSSKIVGHLSDRWATKMPGPDGKLIFDPLSQVESLRSAVMILPAALGVAALLWMALAWRMRRRDS